jgi:hypothetical protein
MVTVLQYELYFGESKKMLTSLALYNIFDPSRNITYVVTLYFVYLLTELIKSLFMVLISSTMCIILHHKVIVKIYTLPWIHILGYCLRSKLKRKYDPSHKVKRSSPNIGWHIFLRIVLLTTVRICLFWIQNQNHVWGQRKYRTYKIENNRLLFILMKSRFSSKQ